MSDDLRFDALLTEGADALPPAPDVSPWRGAMSCIVWGIALKTLTLQLLYLNDILPTLGCILLVLGFRTLRQENEALRWAYGLSIAAAVMRSAAMVLAALPVDVGRTFGCADSALMLGMLIALWRGMTGVSRAAGAEKPSAPAAGALAAFYAVLILLAFIGLEGWLLVLPVLAVYLVILRNLVKLFRSLENTGYAIHAAPVHLPAAAVLWGYLGLTLAAVVLAMLLGQRYPMDWQVRDDAPQDAAIRAELLELGFPQDVLDDLTAEEVARMSGARAVFVNEDKLYNQTKYREIVMEHYLGEDPLRVLRYDRTITTKHDDGTRSYTYVYRAFDTLEQTMTSVAVELAGADGEKHYIVIHHLYYDTQPSSRYTEGMTVWPVWKMESSWRPGTLCSGRVLCTRRGTAQTAALHGLAYDDRQVTGFFGTDRRASFDAQWTRPSGAGDVRMYMLYDAFCGDDAWVLTSYGNYTRQSKPVYPFDGSMLRWGMGDRGACTRYMGYVQKFW
mgnify:CR=1 FL=1